MDLSSAFGESPAVASQSPFPPGVETERLLLTDVAYETESTGHRVDTPVLYCRCRTPDGGLRIVEVEGFRPHFCLSNAEFRSDPLAVLNDRRVLGVEGSFDHPEWREMLELDDEATSTEVAAHLEASGDVPVYDIEDEVTNLEDESLVRVIVTEPGHVGGKQGLRSYFETDHEADIPFVRRFLIDSEVYRGLEVPVDQDRVRFENWHGGSDGPEQVHELHPCEPPDVRPRVCTFDIEVEVGDGGFPEPHRAKNPITAIGAHDSYRDEYRLWGLQHDSWADEDLTDDVVAELTERFGLDVAPDDVEIHASETQMLESFHDWFLECDPDIATGWNSSGFDVPYVIQRSWNVNARQIQNWSLLGNPGAWAEEYNGETQTSYSVQGRSTLDMFNAYQKTQYRDLDSYKLDAVAEAELGHGKVGLAGDELDEAWTDDPVEFFAYNVRDVEAVVEIEDQVELIDLYENLRAVTGALWETCNNNGPMIDTLFLRRAHEADLALPTNEEPDEGVYHGAKVFEPEPGVHENCVYPDLSSMYPNLFAMLNLGTETIVGDAEDLEASAYTAEDCFRFPVDERPFAIVPKGEPIDDVDRSAHKGVKSERGGLREMFDPEISWFYVLKPEHRESFVRSTVDELIELKYKFSGTMYEAVKRVTNSVYGVAGDSESGGKGFRLYNRRVAEGITLAGRLTITHTAEEFTSYLNDEFCDDEAYIVGGDTDSAVTSVPTSPDLLTAWMWSEKAVEHTESSYDEFVQEQFGFDPDDEHRLAVELESLASTLFFMAGDTEKDYVQGSDGYLEVEETTDAVRKRYAQHIVWDDDDGWLDTPDAEDYPGDPLVDEADLSELKHEPAVTYDTYAEGGVLADQNPQDNVGIKGFEYVRSDSAQITRDAQEQILTDVLLSESPADRIETYLTELVDDVRDGEIGLDRLARPKGINNPLDDYGWKDLEELDDEDVTPEAEQAGGAYVARAGTAYRGAKYADDHFPWEELGPGTKPQKIPIERVRSDDYPATYQYVSYPKDRSRPDPLEVGDEVDAVTVDRPERLPDDFVVDYDKIVDKALQGKIEPILETIDLQWNDLLADGSQSSLSAWG